MCPGGDTTNNGLYDVPLLSWVCVGLGLFFSLVFLSKPVWWDKYVLFGSDLQISSLCNKLLA